LTVMLVPRLTFALGLKLVLVHPAMALVHGVALTFGLTHVRVSAKASTITAIQTVVLTLNVSLISRLPVASATVLVPGCIVNSVLAGVTMTRTLASGVITVVT
jgi:hypothetical protein